MFLLLLNFRQNYKAAENIKKKKIENKDREREIKKKEKSDFCRGIIQKIRTKLN